MGLFARRRCGGGQVQAPHCRPSAIVSSTPSHELAYPGEAASLLHTKKKLEEKLGKSNGKLNIRSRGQSSEAGYGREFTFSVPEGSKTPSFHFAQATRGRGTSSWQQAWVVKSLDACGNLETTSKITNNEVQILIRSEGGRQHYTVRLRDNYVGAVKITAAGGASDTIWSEGAAPGANPRVATGGEPSPSAEPRESNAESVSVAAGIGSDNPVDLTGAKLPKTPPSAATGSSAATGTGSDAGLDSTRVDQRVAAAEARAEQAERQRDEARESARTAEAALDSLREQLEAAQTSTAARVKEVARAEATSEELQEQLSELQGIVEKLESGHEVDQSRIDELLASLEAEREAQRSEREEVQGERASLTAEIAQAMKTISELQKENGELKDADTEEDAAHAEEIAALKREAEAARQAEEEKTAALKTNSEEITRLESELRQLNISLTQALQKQGAESQNNMELQAEIQRLGLGIEQLQAQLTQKQEEQREMLAAQEQRDREEAEEDRAHAEELAAATTKVEELTLERDASRAAVVHLERRVEELSQAQKEREPTPEELELQKRQAEEWARQSRALAALERERRELQEENERLQEQLAQASMPPASDPAAEALEMTVIMPSLESLKEDASSPAEPSAPLPEEITETGTQDNLLEEYDFSQQPSSETSTSEQTAEQTEPHANPESSPETPQEPEGPSEELLALEEKLKERERALENYNRWMREQNIREELTDSKFIESLADRTRGNDSAFDLAQQLERMQANFNGRVQRKPWESDTQWNRRFERELDTEIDQQLATIQDAYVGPSIFSGLLDTAAGVFSRDADSAYRKTLTARQRAFYRQGILQTEVQEARAAMRELREDEATHRH